jgi:integrin alpha FG-GAP repeat containing protein 1
MNRDEQPCEFSVPHSNAFLDLDGDCIPGKLLFSQMLHQKKMLIACVDLIFTCPAKERPFIEIWTYEPPNGYKKSFRLDLPTNAGPLSFADIDTDGSTDLLFTSCQNDGCYLHVLFNKNCNAEGCLPQNKCVKKKIQFDLEDSKESFFY